MKKQLFKTAALGAALVAGVLPAASRGEPESGFSLGASLNHVQGQNSFKNTNQINNHVTVNSDLGSNGIGGFISGDYSHFMGNVMMGVSVYAGYTGYSFKHRHILQSTSIAAHEYSYKSSGGMTFGGFFKVGMMFGETLGFLMAGVDSVKQKHTFQMSIANVDDAKIDKFQFGFGLGGGISLPLGGKWSLDTSYRYTWFGKQKTPVKGDDGTILNHASVDLSASIFTLGVSHKF